MIFLLLFFVTLAQNSTSGWTGLTQSLTRDLPFLLLRLPSSLLREPLGYPQRLPVTWWWLRRVIYVGNGRLPMTSCASQYPPSWLKASLLPSWASGWEDILTCTHPQYFALNLAHKRVFHEAELLSISWHTDRPLLNMKAKALSKASCESCGRSGDQHAVLDQVLFKQH